MQQRILITSGPIAAGKSSVISELVKNHGCKKLSSGSYLKEIATERGLPQKRMTLVRLGDALDEATDYSWVVKQLAMPALSLEPEEHFWVFDSARKKRQIELFRDEFGAQIFHCHLTAPDSELERRFILRNSDSDLEATYSHAIDTDNEREARSLIEVADFVVDTLNRSPSAVAKDIFRELIKWSPLC